ncbi:acyltransferase-domain-containing protein [Rickenella mellea]|uniref:Tafazzin family protein n=1 Tax=Rickenella mellea TaxID=50990 RepID=A0A4Y7Q0M0_9AGAM|nr:acyltransferase-domain-containing protein [Rickenella mellea]
MVLNRVLSTTTVTGIGLICKAFLKLGFCSSVTVTGLHHLLAALDSKDRRNGKGLVTVGNHISVLDDPLAWGILPVRTYLHSHTTRWALGASDIMFINPVLSAFFRKGQVLETFRGKGIYQPAVDAAIEKLDHGSWVHLFGEGKVNQPPTYPVIEGVARLPRFKWGTGRIIMETQHLPTIIPMWLTGFDGLMPEPRGFPAFLPRIFPRKAFSITFGAPVEPTRLENVLSDWRSRVLPRDHLQMKPSDDRRSIDVPPMGAEDAEKEKIRSMITDLIQREVETLGRTVSGPLLGKSHES